MVDPQLFEQYQVEKALNQDKIDADKFSNAQVMMQNQQVVQAALIEQINPLHVLEEIELKLQGYERKWDGSIKRRGEPLMNDFGINRVLLLLSSVVNQHTIMSALKDEEIGKLTLELADRLTDNLTLNWKEYGIKEDSELDIIFIIIIMPVYISLKRALEGGERRFLGTTTVESITTAPRITGQKKESFWSNFRL